MEAHHSGSSRDYHQARNSIHGKGPAPAQPNTGQSSQMPISMSQSAISSQLAPQSEQHRQQHFSSSQELDDRYEKYSNDSCKQMGLQIGLQPKSQASNQFHAIAENESELCVPSPKPLTPRPLQRHYSVVDPKAFSDLGRGVPGRGGWPIGFESAIADYEVEQVSLLTIAREYAEIPLCDNSSSMEEFPDDLFTDEQRSNGAIILHIIGAIYFFTLLAVVCNDYFLPSVACICDDLHIPKDLAAATFMAVGTTTPEFFTNVISTFVTESDIGLGTIIGSLMFNTLGVAAVASLAATKPVQLDWWPITRDSILYSTNIILLIIFAFDNQITLVETIIMVIMFFLYFAVIFQNKYLMPRVRLFFEEYLHCCRLSSYNLPSSFIEKNFQQVIVSQPTTPNEKKPKEAQLERQLSKSSINNSSIFLIYTREESIDNDVNKVRKSLWNIPIDNHLKKAWWFYTWAIKFMLTMTIPNPKTYRRLYPITFLMCIIWIGLNAYMVVWMVSVIGYTFRIPDVVMGVTFLAAGGCMPEGISAVLLIRKGEGGFGVSNSLGANSMAILMSLGIPWLIRNLIYRNTPGKQSIALNPKSTLLNMLLLLLTVITLYLVLSIAKYRLKRTVGLVLISVYAVFISLGIMLQMNMFFPDICTTSTSR